MSDRAEMRGPAGRRRRTTIAGGVKPASGSKWHDDGEKPPRYPAQARTDEAPRDASNNGDLGARVSGQQRAHAPRGQKSAAEDADDRLRWAHTTTHACPVQV